MIQRFTCNMALLDECPHIEPLLKDADGGYVRYSDHAAELAKLEDDYLKLNNIACELRTRAERAEAYVAGQDVRSDFRTAGEMRAALDDARAELARVEWERDKLRREVSMLSREVSRESGLRRKIERVLDEHAQYIRENKTLDDQARAATDAAGILKGEAQ